ncbi:MAG: hypothetical protein ACLFWD_08165 [Anaerolineales bacterium]
MLGLGLRRLQEALNRKADEIQRKFLRLSDEIEELNARLTELHGEQRKSVLAKQQELRAQQQEIAEEINWWRERARWVTQSGTSRSIKDMLSELEKLEEPAVQAALEQVRFILESPEEAAQELTYQQEQDKDVTPAGRLLERARTEYDLRHSDPAVRHRAAAEFANRPGIAQDDAVMEELEAAADDPDPLVRELVQLTLIQLHRFRAMRFADLDVAHSSVQTLARMKTRAVVPVLAEILKSARTGYSSMAEKDEPVEKQNTRSRMVALLRLVEWHTPEAQSALRAVQFDKIHEISRAAKHALELFPDPWQGPIQRD